MYFQNNYINYCYYLENFENKSTFTKKSNGFTLGLSY